MAAWNRRSGPAGGQFFLVVAAFVALSAGAYYFVPDAISTFVIPHDKPVVHHAAPVAAVDAGVAEQSLLPQRVINSLTIADVIPSTGKFIAADLDGMKLVLYENGTTTAEFPITKKGKAGTPWETPSGFYAIRTKEQNHFSSIGRVYMPYSMQFYGNYFIHGHPYYPDGTPTASTFSGGCINVSTEDAAKVYAFADVGTKMFVYDPSGKHVTVPLELEPAPAPIVSAGAYIVADIDTGDVYAEHSAQRQYPSSSATKLMTALVANETISFDKKISIAEGELLNPPVESETKQKSFLVGDLFYPLLMQSSDGVANALAVHYGKRAFIRWMNTTASALGMLSTQFVDSNGISSDDVSTPEDLFRLGAYLMKKKSFVLNIADTPSKVIVAEDGSKYTIQNIFARSDISDGAERVPQDTMLSVISFKVGGTPRHIAIIVLGSDNQARDTKNLADWIGNVARPASSQTACASCAAHIRTFRRIDF